MKNTPNITDEMLAAYMAGNATVHETALILRAIDTDPVVRETLRIQAELDAPSAADDILPMMAMAAKNEVDNLCAIRCIGYALRHFGIDVTDEQILEEAESAGSLSEYGMPFGMLGEFVRPHGLNTHYVAQCSVDMLRQELAQGKVVIALVDGGELTGDAALEQQEDNILGRYPDHVVVIDSIAEDSITIRDSYTPQQLDTYPLATFVDAWEDSDRNVLVVENKK